jgi:DNA-binding PadR family transcriptional regulator
MRADDRASAYLVVVPRGEKAIYKALEARVGRQGLVEVIWDRRQGDRRRGDRRQRATDSGRRRLGDRRRPAEDSRALGFVVASRHVGLLEPTKTIEKAETLTFDLAKLLAKK